MRLLRGSLLGVGLVLTAVGISLLFQTEHLDQLFDLVVWLACALVLHDGVFVPLTLALTAVADRTGRALPPAALQLLKIGFVVGAVLTLVVAPALYAQSLGNPNPTILMADYGLRLALVWGGILVVVAAGCLLIVARTRRRNGHTRSTPAEG